MAYDLAVVGAGIMGCAHALAARRLGKSVIVIEKDAQANSASIRNFGFVTITGQQQGEVWNRAMRARDIWLDVVVAADIPVIHQGLMVAAHSAEADAVLDAFRATEMGADCERLTPDGARQRCPMLNPASLTSALYSPHERRVEPREALPKIAHWLAEAQGVDFRFGTLVTEVREQGDHYSLATTGGPVEAGTVVICSGNDFQTLFPERLAAYELELCKLQMARLAPQPAGWKLPCAVMSDTSLVRYLGYAQLPEAKALRSKLEAEIPETLAAGVHLIVVQGEDGSLTIGDSHENAPTPDPFYSDAVERHFFQEIDRTLDIPNRQVIERWYGLYPASPGRIAFVDAPLPRVRIGIVSSGTGMSTAFAIGEEVINELYG